MTEAAVRRTFRAERGSVTAEFAAALPAVVVCLALCVGAVQAGAQQAQLVGAAAAAARLLGRGEDPRERAGATMQVSRQEGMVCVRLAETSAVSGLGALGLTVSARSCALDDVVAG